MKKSVLLVAVLSVVLAVGCASIKPTLQQYSAAKVVLEDPDASQMDREQALAVVHAYEGVDPGINWWEIGGAVAGAVLGLPLLGKRGPQVAGVLIDAVASGNLKRAAQASRAYVGARTSEDLIAVHKQERAAKLKTKAEKAAV